MMNNGWHKITRPDGEHLVRFVRKNSIVQDNLSGYSLGDCLVEEVEIVLKQEYEQMKERAEKYMKLVEDLKAEGEWSDASQ